MNYNLWRAQSNLPIRKDNRNSMEFVHIVATGETGCPTLESGIGARARAGVNAWLIRDDILRWRRVVLAMDARWGDRGCGASASMS